MKIAQFLLMLGLDALAFVLIGLLCFAPVRGDSVCVVYGSNDPHLVNYVPSPGKLPLQPSKTITRGFSFLSAAGAIAAAPYPKAGISPRPTATAWYAGSNKTVYRVWYANLSTL